MFGLLDCNNFYASCERLFKPNLRDKPVVVLSNNDGCVIARSNEVKELGVPMGAPLFKVKEILEKNNAYIFSSNFALYGDISARVMDLVEALVPRIEVYSVDEAFIDFSGIKDIEVVAADIRQQVLKSVGIPTCIGIGPTKTLAKVANNGAKKNPHYQGICLLQEEAETDDILKSLIVKDLWGIGHSYAQKLAQAGIHTGYDLKHTDPKWMRQHFSVVGERIIYELRGVSCLTLEPEPKPRQAIQVSRSFSKKISEYDMLREVVASYATRLATKLRFHKLKTTNVLVSLRTNVFNVNQRQYQNSYLVNLPVAVNDDSSLIKACTQGLKAIYRQGYDYHKAGVMALDLMPINQTQFTLFDKPAKDDEKTLKISSALDKINSKYGRGTVHMAACGQRLTWKDKKIKKSPAYTTCWHELPIVLAK